MSVFNKKISTVIALIFLLSSCQNKTEVVVPEYLSMKEIPDWNAIYPLLLAKALEWDPDAKLDTAFMQVNWQNHQEQRLVSAFFQTSHKKFETLHLQYLSDGTILVNLNRHGVPIPNFDPVERSEWTLNSTEAWDLFLQNRDVISEDPKLFDCSSLILIRKAVESNDKRVVWQLSLADCEHTDFMQYFLDANSGAFLGRERH